MDDTSSEGLAREVARLRRRLDRERAARLEAEAVAERGLRELYEKQRQLEVLEQVATASSQPISVRDMLQFAVTKVCGYTGWPVGHVLVCEDGPDGPAMRSAGIWEVAPSERIQAFRRATETAEFAPGIGLPGRTQSSGLAHWIADLSLDGNYQRAAAARECGLRAAFAFPVKCAGQVAAVIEFYGHEPQPPDETLLALLTQIGTLLGRVLERKRAEDRLVHDASHDPLTGLPNRALFRDRLEQAFRRFRRNPRLGFAVLFIDLDRFKVVNDSLGHQAGDTLIVDVARRLLASLRREDLVVRAAASEDAAQPGENTLARLGGDEFTVLLNDIRDPIDAIRVADRILEALTRPFRLIDQEVYTSASIGIAVGLPTHGSPDEVLRDADLAMYRAKSLGKARSELYDRTMHDVAVRRLQLETDLRRALQQDEFVLHFQPIVALHDGSVTGFEALVRWRRPDGVLVFPADFIHVAEETGLILYLGLWVLREACRTTVAWQRAYPRATPLTVSVNISVRQFQQPELVDQVRQILEETGIDPATVRLEITESVTVGDGERAVEVLTRLKRLGVQLSLDDFGTGYSSLSYLQRFPLDILKIDRSFVSGMSENQESRQIIDTIMNLARNLDMQVVAEGTEKAVEVAQLRQLGCEYGQGYFFSRPVAAEAVPALLERAGTVSRLAAGA